MRLTSILVGIDFTPCSASALAQALRLARYDGARVRALHVIEALVVEDLREAVPPLVEGLTEGLLEDARKAWEAFAPDVDKSRVDFRVVIGNPLEEMQRHVAESAADLLVMGTHGTTPEHLGAGTLAVQSVRRAPVDVMLVRQAHRGAFRCVVVGVDFSATSQRALEIGAHVAARDAAALHAVHVFRPPWKRLHYRAPTPEARSAFQKQYADALARRLNAFSTGTVGGSGVRTHLHENGSAGVGLAEVAARLGADLIVVGKRGHTTLRDLLLGSTAERLLRQAPCSILTVMPPHSPSA